MPEGGQSGDELEKPRRVFVQQNAEESAIAVIDKIVTKGGQALYKQHVKNQTYGLAKTAATESTLSNVEMCFVPHDAAEDPIEWAMEAEPDPVRVDSWAPISLQCADIHARLEGQAEVRFRGKIRRSCSTRPASPAKSDKQRSGAVPLPDTHVVDAGEEKARIKKKIKDEKKREEEERQQRLYDEQVAEEKAQIEKQARESKPCTYDHNGNRIWIVYPDEEELPPLQETFEYSIPYDPNDHRAQTDPRAKSRRHRAKEKHKFTDSFYRPDTMQPLLVDVISLKPGVKLQCSGYTKNGSMRQDEEYRMSRLEYKELVKWEDNGRKGQRPVSAAGTKFTLADSSVVSSHGSVGKTRPSSAPSGKVVLEEGVTAVPPKYSHLVGVCAQGKVQQMSTESNLKGSDGTKKVRQAARAPSMIRRYRTSEKSLGDVSRRPRDHMPFLGSIFSRTQSAGRSLSASGTVNANNSSIMSMSQTASSSFLTQSAAVSQSSLVLAS